MNTTCPHGHVSQTADYCDQCGALLVGRSTPPPAHAAAPPAASSTSSAVEVDVSPDTKPCVTPEPCPECQTPRVGSDRFCEGCGYNFLTGERGLPSTTSSPSEQPEAWELLVEADRDYFERVATEEIEFPARYQPRTFALQDAEVCIGRHSATRGTRPQIDLSGAPEDLAISHSQAILVRQEDGSYALVDPGSSNGTTLNDDLNPIAPNTPVPLVAGDRIHIGAWTTMTIRGGEV
jgi:hypothetical protein